MEELTEAMGTVQRAVNLMPKDHLNRASTLRTLGLIYLLRGSATTSLKDVTTAIELFKQSWHTTSSVPRWRLQSAGRAVWLSTAYGDVDEAITLGKEVMSLLPVLDTKDLTISDRQEVLGDFDGIAHNVCAAFLSRGKVKEALQFLEQGRAILIRQLLNDRIDLTDMQKTHPDIVNRYEEIRKEIQNTAVEFEDEASVTARERRQGILREYNDIAKKISEFPGHTAFYAGQTVEQMQQCVKDGAVVIVNFTINRYNAVIVTRSGLKAIDLSDTVDEKVWSSWSIKEWIGRRSEMPKKNKDYLAYLAWIWESCAKRILEVIRLDLGASEEEPLRIWWIGSGNASSIPFHAAGIHEPGSTATVYHQTISSYTPSINVLWHAQRQTRASEWEGSSLAIVTMKTTPGGEGDQRLSNLPGVEDEEAAVTKLVEKYAPVEQLKQPSVTEAVDSLRRHTIAHFACHGTSDVHDPSQSALVLQKSRVEGRTEVYVQDRLTMGELSSIKLQRARLAYLSACSTAQSNSVRHRDEVLHVVSGFIVAGFPHTVGCLWQSSDRMCVSVAEAFYTELFRVHGSHWQDDDVARSLREAVMQQRAKELRTPLLWAPFVHYGI
ncbi:hypothetical protein C8035_v010954 [Colletotrichum spinosum]|uniref:CHAT domain-containing protein n=1 Tax=Colletotrichum spinosum TaxID=1347390 RepID=A0A4R8Q5K6_9PEZI|nr:hypothetical protein C8035_v010954 [Colletotrichum spinosum]